MTSSTPSDLAERLLVIAYDIAAESGPASVSLRDVQRRAGVSAATAYWHYKDRAALLLAVSRRATSALADALTEAIATADDPESSDLAAVCLGYMHFARDHQGLFQAVVLNSSTDEIMHPSDAARGAAGLAAFEVLQRAVADFPRSDDADGVTDGDTVGDDPSVHVWASCHGLAALLIDTPMASLPESERESLRRQHVRFILGSL